MCASGNAGVRMFSYTSETVCDVQADKIFSRKNSYDLVISTDTFGSVFAWSAAFFTKERAL